MQELATKLEAYETEAWPIEAILDVELLSAQVVDPCVGYFAIADIVAKRGYQVETRDIYQWNITRAPDVICNYLNHFEDLSGKTVIMNPPFSLACQFVDHCRALGARKIICFQRYSWREGTFANRGSWWEANPPARIWLCGDRAQCLRFDLRGQKLAKPPTAHAWFVWENGHRGAEITRGLYK